MSDMNQSNYGATGGSTGSRGATLDQGGMGGAQTRQWADDIQTRGKDLFEQTKRLASEAQTRKIKITGPGGSTVLEAPLALGAIAGGALVFAAPALAVIAGAAAVFSRVKFEVKNDALGHAADKVADKAGQIGDKLQNKADKAADKVARAVDDAV